MERNSFTFYRSFYESIRLLPPEVQAEAYGAIMAYGLDGTLPEGLNPVALSIFTLVRPLMDANNARYSNARKGGTQRHREDGNAPDAPEAGHRRTADGTEASRSQAAGGTGADEPRRARGIDASGLRSGNGIDAGEHRLTGGTQANVEQSAGETQPNGEQSATKTQPNGEQSASETQPNVEQNAAKPQPNVEQNAGKPLPNIGYRIKEEYKERLTDVSPKKAALSSPLPFQRVVEGFNKELGGRLPQVQGLTEKRRAAVRARVAEYGLDAVWRVFGKVRASGFLTGENSRGWRADFDWIFRPGNFPKILEGNYDDTPGGMGGTRLHTADDEAVVAKLGF